MRFECKVRIVNRNPGAKSGTFYIKSTIALGKETNTENDYFLLHFSNVVRGSLKGSRYTKYRLKFNPTKLFTKCINEGKITVSFEEPPHDLFIQGNAAQLARFVELLNTCLAGEPGVLQPSSLTQAARDRYTLHVQEEKRILLQRQKFMQEALNKKPNLPIQGTSKSSQEVNKVSIGDNNGTNQPIQRSSMRSQEVIKMLIDENNGTKQPIQGTSKSSQEVNKVSIGDNNGTNQPIQRSSMSSQEVIKMSIDENNGANQPIQGTSKSSQEVNKVLIGDNNGTNQPIQRSSMRSQEVIKMLIDETNQPIQGSSISLQEVNKMLIDENNGTNQPIQGSSMSLQVVNKTSIDESDGTNQPN